MRIRLCVLVALGLLLAPAPAWARWCADVPEYSATDLNRIERFLYFNSPARLAPVMRGARVELVNDDPLALSMTIRDGAPVVRIPRGFRALHCRLVMLSALLPRTPEQRRAELAAIRKEILGGFAATGSLPDALNRTTGDRLARLERSDLTPLAARRVEDGWTADAMKGLLLHEVVHILQVAERSDPAREGEPEPGASEVEFDADWQGGLLGSLAGVNVTLANIYNFEILSSVDSLIPEGAAGHARFRCRMDSAMNIHRALQYGPIALARIADPADPVWKAYQDRLLARRTNRGLDMSDWAFTQSPGCEIGPREGREHLALHAIKSEMAEFYDLQAAIADVRPEAGETRVPYLAVMSILSHRPDSRLGRRLRIAIVMRYLEKFAADESEDWTAIIHLGAPVLSSYGLDDALTHDYARIAWLYRDLMAKPGFAARAKAVGHSDETLSQFGEALKVRLERVAMAEGDAPPFLGPADGPWFRDAPAYALDLGAGLEPSEQAIFARYQETAPVEGPSR